MNLINRSRAGAHGEEASLAGICFAHQIVGRVLGGTVRKTEQGWGPGVRTAEVPALHKPPEPPQPI